MPQPASTKKKQAAKNKLDKSNIEYIVRGSSPLYSALSVLSFVLIVASIAMQVIELTQDYGFPPTIFF